MTVLTDELRHQGRMILNLRGYEELSLWGWDERDQTLYAQIWANDDDPDAPPTYWIVELGGYGRWPRTQDPEQLAEYISMATGRPEGEVRQAMCCTAPASVKLRLLGQAAA